MHVQGCRDLTSIIALSGGPPTFGTWCFLLVGKLGQSLVPLRLIFNCSHRGCQRRGDIKACDVLSHYILRCILKERKSRCFKGKECFIPTYKTFFLCLLVFWLISISLFFRFCSQNFWWKYMYPQLFEGFWYSCFLIAWNYLGRYHNHISLTTFVGSQMPRR